MNIVARSTTLQSSFTPEAVPQLQSSNTVCQIRSHGLAAHWVKVEGKLQCQWD